MVSPVVKLSMKFFVGLIFILLGIVLFASDASSKLANQGNPGGFRNPAGKDTTAPDYQNHTMFGLSAGELDNVLTLDPWLVYPKTGRTMLDDARSRGIEIWRVNVSWSAYEPEPGQYGTLKNKHFLQGYIQFKKDEIDAAVARGYKVELKLMFWDPPGWVWDIPDFYYKNQYGSEYKIETEAESAESGAPPFGNMTFNPKIRKTMEKFITRFFEDFKDYKDKIWAIDLSIGGGGDVWIPFASQWRGDKNTWWAFDRNAQDLKNPGSLAGPDPVPGWIPGTHDDPTHEKARKFLNWYLESGNQVVLWEVGLFRKYYPGLVALASDLFFKEANLSPHIESDLDGSADDPSGTAYWSPAGGVSDGRYLKSLLDKYGTDGFILYHTGLELSQPEEFEVANREMSRLGGENATMTSSGLDAGQTMRSIFEPCIERVKKYHLSEMVWMTSDGVYEKSLKDPAYDVTPEYYEEQIREVNGAPAQISNIQSRSVGASGAEITWETDVPADSRVVFCEDHQMRTNAKSVYEASKSIEHHMIINFSAGKPVYFEVGSDNGNNYALSHPQKL